jgi:Holliday junction resolvase RusA-like endonuclease
MAPRLTFADVFPGKGKRPVRAETRHAPTGSFGLVADARPEKQRVELNIMMPPSANNMFVNNPHGGRFRSAQYDGWLSEAGWMLAAQKPGRIAGGFEIDVLIPRPTRKGKCDLDNRLKPILDLLTKHRVIADDSLAEKITLAWGVGDMVRVVLTKAEGVPA